LEPLYLQILDTEMTIGRSVGSPLHTHATWQPQKWGLHKTQFPGASTQVSGVILPWQDKLLDRIKQITVNIKDANVYSVGTQGNGVGGSSEISRRQSGAKYLKSIKAAQAKFYRPPAQLNHENVCTGTVETSIQYSIAELISQPLALQISTVKVGLSFASMKRSARVACGTGSGGTSAGDQGSTSNAGTSTPRSPACEQGAAAVIQALADLARKNKPPKRCKKSSCSREAAAGPNRAGRSAEAVAAANDATPRRQRQTTRKSKPRRRRRPRCSCHGKCYDSVTTCERRSRRYRHRYDSANRY